MYRRWVALADPTDHFEGVQGYLRLSVTALSSSLSFFYFFYSFLCLCFCFVLDFIFGFCFCIIFWGFLLKLMVDDVAPVHSEDEEEDEEQDSTTNLQAMVLLPPTIQVFYLFFSKLIKFSFC